MSDCDRFRQPPRVVITGLGMVSPLGGDAPTHFRQLLDGARAARALPELSRLLPADLIRSDDWSRWIGAPALGYDVPPPRDVLERMLRQSAQEALNDAGHDALTGVPPERRGCVIGASKPLELPAPSTGGDDLCWSRLAAPSTALAGDYGIAGPLLVPSAACATGLISLIRGVELIREGACDMVLAGSGDWSLSPGYLAGYRRLGVLAKPGDDPAAACRPFDARRAGFVVGCGAALLVLERRDRALQRGATIHAEWLGHAMAGDAGSIVDVDTSGATPARVIQDALRRSGLTPDRVDVISLHGTGTRANDLCETRGVRRALGPAADRASCFSLKGSIGHLMGAAGSVETATLTMALRQQVAPPTMNLEHPDPDCNLDYTPLRPVHRPLRIGLKLSLGFGGACAAALLHAPAPDPGD